MKSREISVRLDEPLYQRLAKEADREGESVSYVIREACRMYLDAQDVLTGRKKRADE